MTRNSAIGIAVPLLVTAILISAFSAGTDEGSLAADAKSCLHTVQLGVERYYVDHGAYPLLLSESVDYISVMPENPCLPGERMRQVSPEEFYPGGIVYHPFSLDGEVIDHYFLGVFGAKKDGGKDLFLTGDRIHWVGDYRFWPDRKRDGKPEGLIMLMDDLGADAVARLQENRRLIYQLPENTVAELDASAKERIQELQVQIERCRIDWGLPEDLEEAIEYGSNNGGVTELPENPYYLVNESAAPKMRAAKLGEAASGDMVYHLFSTGGKVLDRYILLVKGGRGSSDVDIFYGEVAWDNLYTLFDPPVQPDSRSEGFIIALNDWDDSTRKLLREKPWLIYHDAAWFASQVDERAREAAFQMQIAVERYSIDHDVYPPNLRILIDQGYTYWPLNPYAESDPSAPTRVAQVEPGDFIPGGIVYFPFEFPGYEGKGLSAYSLGIYGSTPDGGSDVGAMTPHGWRFYWYGEKQLSPPGFPAERDGEPDGFVVVLTSGRELPLESST